MQGFPQVQDGPPRGYSGNAPGVLHIVRRGSLLTTAHITGLRGPAANLPRASRHCT